MATPAEIAKKYEELGAQLRAAALAANQKLLKARELLINTIPDNNNPDYRNQLMIVSKLQNEYDIAKQKADNVKVTTSTSTAKDGDKTSGSTTYQITDENGNTQSFSDSSDNGMRTQEQTNAANAAYKAAELSIQNTQQMAGAAKEQSLASAALARDSAVGLYKRDLDKADTDYQNDIFEKDSDLLRASNETFSGAVKNSREMGDILSAYNLSGSSLEGQMRNIAADAANKSNSISALTYNKARQDTDTQYNDTRQKLEDNLSTAQNLYGSRAAEAEQTYHGQIATAAGQAAEKTSQWDYGDYKTGKTDQYAEQASQAAKDMGAVRQDPYISKYTEPAQQTYRAGLAAYRPVNSNTMVYNKQPNLKQTKE